MAVYRFEADVDGDRHVQLPVGIPQGKVDITISPRIATDANWDNYKSLICELAEGPRHKRTKDEIVAAIRHERESTE